MNIFQLNRVNLTLPKRDPAYFENTSEQSFFAFF